MITVLVTGVGGGVGQGILKCLRRMQGLDVKVIAADMSPLAAGLYAGDRAVLLPAAHDSGYINEVLELCRRESIDFYMPGTDGELRTCAENADYVRDEVGTEIVVSPPSVVSIADDKYETFRFLLQAGLPHPATYLPGEIDPDKLGYPVIVKPRIGCRSMGVELAHSPDALRAALAAGENLLIQEHVGTEDDEYTCTVVSVEDDVSDPVIFRRVLRSGDTFRATPVLDKTIADHVRLVALRLGVRGPCNVQLRVDEGIPKIFEINSRFSGTTPFCAAVGFNPVEFYLKTRMGIPYKSRRRFDVTIFRAWSEVVVDNVHIESLRESGLAIPQIVEKSAL